MAGLSRRIDGVTVAAGAGRFTGERDGTRVVNKHVYYAGPMSAPKCPSYQEQLRAALRLLRAEQQKRKSRFYGFPDLRGRPAGRGSGSRASRNQVVAGVVYGSPGKDDFGIVSPARDRPGGFDGSRQREIVVRSF